ncbi:MAG TPA: alpha-hydroxy acid oxidase [Acidimicrobiia bacterium]|nr:alpha-hydroxy acid oxidase [Acidimicrobiia bacterium]
MTEPIDLSELKTIDQVIERARQVTAPGAHVWAAAGAGQGVTTTRNALALNRLALVPRVMRDVGAVDVSSSLVGIPLSLPVMAAPVGSLTLYHRDDALAAALAATETGTSVFCSTLSTSSWEEVAATAPGRHLFQLYVLGDRSWVGDILKRVEGAGFGAVCVTVDTPVIGRRDRSLEDGFIWAVPPEGPPNLVRHGMNYAHRARHSWADLAWLCSRTELPVLLKGVMTPEDATEAVECGVAGVYVSNHGGRVVDQGVSTIEMLAEVVEAVGNRAEVMVDSGFSRGADVCKALALGAKAVGIGRLQCWGLAVGGAAGLVRVFEILRDEIANTMANLGCATVADLTPGHVRWSIPAPPPG